MQRLRAWVALLACCSISISPLAARSQAAQPIGSITDASDTYVNGAAATAGQTLFVGETLRTGAQGVAVVQLSGRGTLTVGPLTQLSFVTAPRVFASLQSGAVGLRALADAQEFQIQIGNFVVVPVPGAEAVAALERTSAGSSRVTCEAGSVGVLELDGPQAVFLKAGQSLQVTAEGRIADERGAAPPPPQPQPGAGGGGGRAAVILIVVGAGAGGAALALSRRGEQQAISPSRP